MSTQFKSLMREVMRLAWQMVKKNGFSMSEALKNRLDEYQVESSNERKDSKVLLPKGGRFTT